MFPYDNAYDQTRRVWVYTFKNIVYGDNSYTNELWQQNDPTQVGNNTRFTTIFYNQNTWFGKIMHVILFFGNTMFSMYWIDK